MTNTDSKFRSVAARLAFLVRILPSVPAQFAEISRRREARAMLEDLASRPDYLLSDVGLSRKAIEQAMVAADADEVAMLLARARGKAIERQ
jgi:uncharacterized protein YjiS (DUF1127 family)